eukprot:COSAG01_NODE_1962_length_8790_cov_10.999540_5_plen_86_part_00
MLRKPLPQRVILQDFSSHALQHNNTLTTRRHTPPTHPRHRPRKSIALAHSHSQPAGVVVKRGQSVQQLRLLSRLRTHHTPRERVG